MHPKTAASDPLPSHLRRLAARFGAAWLAFCLVVLALPSELSAQAFQGRPARAADLPGAWVRATPGHWLGIEFTRDGQVMVTQDVSDGLIVRGQASATFTFRYSALEGGRLSFIAPSGQTFVFETKTSGDQLELTIPTEQISILGMVGLEFGGQQRFRKLPSGKSLTQAIREENERMAAEREQRLTAVKRVLAAGNLVIVPQQGNAPVIALRATPASGGLQGTAIVDESPDRPDFIRPIRVHPYQISFGEAAQVIVTISLAGALEPISERQVTGNITLKAEGAADRPTLSGTVQFDVANRLGGRCVLKSDARAHNDVLTRLDAQHETVKKMLATITGPIGGRAILVGTKPAQGMPQPQPVELVVQRTPQGNAFVATATVGRQQLSGGAAPNLVIDRPVLHVAFQGGEEWRLRVNPDGKSFTGDWRPYQGADFLSNGTVNLTIKRMWTVEQLAAIAKAVERYLTTDLRNGVEFVGRVRGLFASSEQTTVPVPVSLKLQSQPDGKVTGQAWFEAQKGGFELEGAVAPNGGLIGLKSTRVMEGSDNSFAQGLGRAPLAAQLTLDIDPQPKLVGALKSTGPWGGGGATEFEPANGAAVAQQKSKILAALGAGANFVIKQDQGMKPSYVRLKADAGGKITGELVGAGYGDFESPGIFNGEVVAERGQAVVKLNYHSAPRLNGIQFADTPCSLLAEFDGDKLTLAGWQVLMRLIAARGGHQIGGITLLPLPAAEKAPAPTDLERVLLAAARLGAVTEQALLRDPIKKTNPGDQALVLLNVRGIGGYIQGGYADGRYQLGLASFSGAAMHAGILTPNQLFAIVRVTFAPPFTESIPASEQNGIKVYAFNANPRAPSKTPTFTIERVAID